MLGWLKRRQGQPKGPDGRGRSIPVRDGGSGVLCEAGALVDINSIADLMRHQYLKFRHLAMPPGTGAARPLDGYADTIEK